MFSWTPQEPTAGDVVTFDGSSSYDDLGGTILEWTWFFGDASSGTGNPVEKTYTDSGTYEVFLRVRNHLGEQASTTRNIAVREPRIDLVPYEHPSGFRIPIPGTWDVTVDEEFEGTIFELTVSERSPGPYGVLTNVLVDTDRDPTVRETTAYLDQQMDIAIEELRRESPNAVIREGPTHLRVANHSAVSMRVGYSGDPMVQRLVAVVSDPHDRYWILLLTTSEAEFEGYNALFDEMIAGFEVTLAPPAFNSGLMAVSVGGVLAAVIGVLAVALLAVRSRKAKVARLVTQPSAPRLCATCGTLATSPSDRYCTLCGTMFTVAPEPAGTGPGALVAPTRLCVFCGTPAATSSQRYCIRCGAPFSGMPARVIPASAPSAELPPPPPERNPGTDEQLPP